MSDNGEEGRGKSEWGIGNREWVLKNRRFFGNEPPRSVPLRTIPGVTFEVIGKKRTIMAKCPNQARGGDGPEGEGMERGIFIGALRLFFL